MIKTIRFILILILLINIDLPVNYHAPGAISYYALNMNDRRNVSLLNAWASCFSLCGKVGILKNSLHLILVGDK